MSDIIADPIPVADEPSDPCGGCGATQDRQRCMGCLHDFGTPESAWVRKYHAPEGRLRP